MSNTHEIAKCPTVQLHWLANCFNYHMVKLLKKYRHCCLNLSKRFGFLWLFSILCTTWPLFAEATSATDHTQFQVESVTAAHPASNSDTNRIKKETESIEPTRDATELKNYLQPKKLHLRSSAALVMDEHDNVTLYQRHANKKRPIASLTKLMTAMVVLDANLPMDETITIIRDDQDKIRRSRSRLHFGVTLSRADMLLMALAASENRAALSLARTYPGGSIAFVKAMNRKAKELGLVKTRYLDAAGLHTGNVSTPKELAVIIEAAYQYPLIRQMTTTKRAMLYDAKSNRYIAFVNTNRLIRNDNWDIELSKTGFISEAGFCLVMRARVASRPVVIVLLNSWGKLSKYGDANRIKSWLLNAEQKLLNSKADFASVN